MSFFRGDRLRPTAVRMIVAALLSATVAALAGAADNHSTGFTRYARVDRPDGTYRNMLVDNVSLAALRKGRSTERTTILMESFSGDELTSIFIKRREGGRWAYGSIRPGEGPGAFRPGPQCATCHRVADDGEGLFTRPMLEGFVTTGVVQQAFCDRSGRAPCRPDVYARTPR